MNAFHFLTLILSAVLSVAYVCRLGLLDVRRHRLPVVLLHVAGLGTVFNAGLCAWKATTDLQDALSLAMAGIWIAISVWNWAGRVPDHWMRR